MKPAQVFTMHLIAAYAYSTRAGVIFWFDYMDISPSPEATA
jgi:hypothetical protein